VTRQLSRQVKQRVREWLAPGHVTSAG
jgi:hypothetical protein